MSTTSGRILVIDDNPAIHDDFRKILAGTEPTSSALDDMEALLFDAAPRTPTSAVTFEVTCALQGQEGLRHVAEARAAGRPYAVTFVDMRMPTGWDGLETIEQIWKVDPDVQVVISSAYSDYSWSDVRARLGHGKSDSLLIIKKPFDTIEVVQCAHALVSKWELARTVRAHVKELEDAVAERTAALHAANQRLTREMHERERMESELRLAQKLEAVGQLASGIAHEINTPLQYVGNNIEFLRESVDAVIAATHSMMAAASASPALQPLFVEIARAAGLGDLEEEVPSLFASLENGIERIAKIVLAMKGLAHPGPREAIGVDVERALRNALEVTHAAYRYFADVETSFAPLPLVVCYGSELNQVFLNLIVNAAQAMEACKPRRGKLTIASWRDGAYAVVAIGDTGSGILPEHRDRVFDAFFTTKEPGRGTGQGLTISRSIVVDRHGGTLTFESTPGVGTTFFVRVPIAGPHTVTRTKRPTLDAQHGMPL